MARSRTHLGCGEMASAHSENGSSPFTLGAFRVDPSRRIIAGPQGEVTVEPKIMAVLQMLAARPGEVVSRREFIESVWATEFGGDESLTRAISQLRKIFGDANGNHRYIETVPRTGYRLARRPDEPPEHAARKRKRIGVISFAVVGALAILVTAVLNSRQQTEVRLPQAPVDRAPIVVAVLPFEITGGSRDDEPLAFGVADEILSALSRNPSLAVIAGNSSFQFRGERKKDLETLGRQLNANYVVDGSLRRSAQGLRIGVHLIDTGSGLVEWSSVLTRPDHEFYMIPGEVAAGVQTALGAEPMPPRPRRDSPDPAAYEAYLFARSLLRQPLQSNIDAAIEQLEHAVDLDPDFSEAWSTLAITRAWLGFSEGPARATPGAPIWSERMRAGRQNAYMALALDPESVDARVALALIDFREQAVSLSDTVERVQKLVVSAPNHGKLNYNMGMLMGSVGRFGEAIRYFGRARMLDPLNFLNTALYADALLCSGEIDDALNIVRSLGAIDEYHRKYTGLIMDLQAAGFEAARRSFTELGPHDLFAVDGVVNIPSLKVDSNVTQRLSRLMERLIDVTERASVASDPTLATDLVGAADEGLITHFYVAQLLAVAGYTDAALDLVMQRIAVGDFLIRGSGILLRPAFAQARLDPGIMAYFAKTGQLDYWRRTENWPDYCRDPSLPYECADAARRFGHGSE